MPIAVFELEIKGTKSRNEFLQDCDPGRDDLRSDSIGGNRRNPVSGVLGNCAWRHRFCSFESGDVRMDFFLNFFHVRESCLSEGTHPSISVKKALKLPMILGL